MSTLGFEPKANGLKDRCSTTELCALLVKGQKHGSQKYVCSGPRRRVLKGFCDYLKVVEKTKILQTKRCETRFEQNELKV